MEGQKILNQQEGIEFVLPEKKKRDRKAYFNSYMKEYNNKPKVTCEGCGKQYKPCSLKKHLKTKYHNDISSMKTKINIIQNALK